MSTRRTIASFKSSTSSSQATPAVVVSTPSPKPQSILGSEPAGMSRYSLQRTLRYLHNTLFTLATEDKHFTQTVKTEIIEKLQVINALREEMQKQADKEANEEKCKQKKAEKEKNKKVDSKKAAEEAKKAAEKRLGRLQQAYDSFVDYLLGVEKKPKFYFSDPMLVFAAITEINQNSSNITNPITAFIGSKNNPASPLYNQDLVMGLIFNFGDLKIKFRVDFDEGKKLHINMEFITADNIFPFAISQLSAPDGRFHVLPQYDGKENTQLELTKFKYFIKMTGAYLSEYPAHSEQNNIFMQTLESLYDEVNLKQLFEDKEKRDKILLELIKEYTRQRKDRALRVSSLLTDSLDSNIGDASSEPPPPSRYKR